MLGANRPATTDFWLLFVGYQGGKPILIVTDSIGKALPSHKNWRHELMTGKTFTNVTDSIYNRTILIGGVRVVVIHMGTNSIDYRVWGRGGAGKWENQLEAIKGEVSSLFRAIRSFNATCFIIFSAVLPRKCDWQHTVALYRGVNSFLKAFCKAKNCGFMPTYSSFIFKSGPCKGCPMGHLFARLDKGLHLNLSGRHILTERFRMALSPKQLLVSARAAKFKHV